MTLVFAMAVPAGWGDETRWYNNSHGQHRLQERVEERGMINVQIARIDDALSRLARLESASTIDFHSSELEHSQGQHRLQERVDRT